MSIASRTVDCLLCNVYLCVRLGTDCLCSQLTKPHPLLEWNGGVEATFCPFSYVQVLFWQQVTFPTENSPQEAWTNDSSTRRRSPSLGSSDAAAAAHHSLPPYPVTAQVTYGFLHCDTDFTVL